MATKQKPIMVEIDPIYEPYASCPLHGTADSARLVTVEPELRDGVISCHISTATFSQRPQYDTLSYRWGDESVKKTILVNNVDFAVTENLLQALDFLRLHHSQKPVWIDAISINQRDIDERTRQLRIMSHIYARANSVLVWLGKTYNSTTIDFDADDVASKKKIATDAYWERVWILQEIGKARKVSLGLGNQIISWDRFMAWLDRSKDAIPQDAGPFKLHQLREEKYEGSCSLKQLLINHESARCKDPRDKVYGLVGLSTDGRGFPLDYQKSLLEVWTDTIRFMSRHQLLPESPLEKLQFCELVRRLLGGNDVGVVSGVTELYNTEDNCAFYHRRSEDNVDVMAQSALSFYMPFYGVIVNLGPTTTEMVDSLEVTDAWEAELQATYPGDQGRAHAEQDGLMRKVLDSSDCQLTTLSSFEHYPVECYGQNGFHGFWNIYFSGRVPPETKGGYRHEPLNKEEPRLAMVKRSFGTSTNTDCKLALVHPSAQKGDIICRFQEQPMKKVVLKTRYDEKDEHTALQVRGTAIMASDILAEETWDSAENHSTDGFQVAMDAKTLYAVLFGDEGQ